MSPPMMLGCYRTRPLLRPAIATAIVVAVALVAFTSLDPYLDAEGLCGLGGCQKPAQSSQAAPGGANAGANTGTSGGTSGGASGVFSGACLVAALAVFLAAPAFARTSGGRRVEDHRRPADAYLPTGTPPPRVLTSR